jgi:hypothetical protein
MIGVSGRSWDSNCVAGRIATIIFIKLLRKPVFGHLSPVVDLALDLFSTL